MKIVLKPTNISIIYFFKLKVICTVFFFKNIELFFERHLEALFFGLVRVATIFLLFLQPQLGHFFLCDHKPRTSTFVSILVYNCSTTVRWKSLKVAEGWAFLLLLYDCTALQQNKVRCPSPSSIYSWFIKPLSQD